MATHSSILAWRIPGTGEPGRLQSMGSHRVRHDWIDLAAAAAAAAAADMLTLTPFSPLPTIQWILFFLPQKTPSFLFSSPTSTFTLWIVVVWLLRPGRLTVCLCYWCLLFGVQLFVTSWTIAHQAPLSMRFLRQEYWSGLPFPSPGDLPNPRIEPASPALAGRFFTTEPPGKPLTLWIDL